MAVNSKLVRMDAVEAVVSEVHASRCLSVKGRDMLLDRLRALPACGAEPGAIELILDTLSRKDAADSDVLFANFTHTERQAALLELSALRSKAAERDQLWTAIDWLLGASHCYCGPDDADSCHHCKARLLLDATRKPAPAPDAPMEPQSSNLADEAKP